jgi:hypothetical protein
VAKQLREQRSEYALAVGVLLFSVSLLLLRHDDHEIIIRGQEVSVSWLGSFYAVFGWLSLAGSVLAIAAVFFQRIEVELKSFFTGHPKSRLQAACQVALPLFTLWMYMLTWTDGLRALADHELASEVVLWVGLCWLVIVAIPLLRLRPALRVLFKSKR